VKQLGLDPGTGVIELCETPMPARRPDAIIVRSAFSLISSGTELSKLDLAKKSLLDKARERPDQVAKVLDAVRTDGLVATALKVRERLATPQPLGYSLAGTILEVGEGCDEFHVGMRVACGGASAAHAEIVSIPRNLAVPIPEGVALRDACFATVGSVALHGLRTANVALGDRVLVIGLGLIGQLTVRLCVAAGAHVFGVDPRSDRLALALQSGACAGDSALDGATALQVFDWSAGRGADVVLITAGGADNQPLVVAGAAARDRARVVVVGAVDLDVPRESFYEKELSLVVSRSYGPGRYDPSFEEKGMTYPVGFVPWTERRNMEELLNLLASERLSLSGLNDLSVPFERAPEGYDLLAGKDGPSPVSVVLEYEPDPDVGRANAAELEILAGTRNGAGLGVTTADSPSTFTPRSPQVSFIGLGNFASSHLLPAVRRATDATLEHVVTATPLKAETARRRAGFRAAGTSAADAIDDPQTEVVFIATRHDSHARYAELALRANKAVFVEKPLALNATELDRVATVIRATQGRLMVGFNRRFAPATRWALEQLGANSEARAGLRFLCRVNAGALPHHHWLLDPDTGGGRLLGEGCHFIDLACFVAGAAPSRIHASALDSPHLDAGHQSFRIEIEFTNGATAGIDYLAGGDASLPKERIEIHRSGTSIVIDDFRSASVHRAGRRRTKTWASRDKGHNAEVRAFLDAVRTGARTPIPEEESFLSTALTLAAARSIREARPLERKEW
jgi:predicted dehydrogenase/threonine dehydrogenase-like Zn-dependent dehydrogenase